MNATATIGFTWDDVTAEGGGRRVFLASLKDDMDSGALLHSIVTWRNGDALTGEASRDYDALCDAIREAEEPETYILFPVDTGADDNGREREVRVFCEFAEARWGNVDENGDWDEDCDRAYAYAVRHDWWTGSNTESTWCHEDEIELVELVHSGSYKIADRGTYQAWRDVYVAEDGTVYEQKSANDGRYNSHLWLVEV